jgi:hypothetical protein
MAAITQIRHRHSTGRAYYDRKVAEGKTHKESLRCLKRRISDAMCARLQADARQAAAAASTKGPGGQPGNDSDASAPGSHPEHRLFGQATLEPGTILRPVTQSDSTVAKRNSKRAARPLDTKESRYDRPICCRHGCFSCVQTWVFWTRRCAARARVAIGFRRGVGINPGCCDLDGM